VNNNLAKFLALVMLCNGFFLLQQSTRLNFLPALIVPFIIPGAAIVQMLEGDLQADLDCNFRAGNNNRPKKNVKVQLGGHVMLAGDQNERFDFPRQTVKTNSDGRSVFFFTDAFLLYLQALADNPSLNGNVEDYRTMGQFEGKFKGRKTIDEYGLDCFVGGSPRTRNAAAMLRVREGGVQ